MLNEYSTETLTNTNRPYYLSWAAVLAGALSSIGISFLLNLFNTAIGLSLFCNSKEGIMTIAIGGFIITAIGGVIAMFMGGWVAGYLNRSTIQDSYLGILDGFIAWCLALVIAAFFVAHAGQLVTAQYSPLSAQMTLTGVHHKVQDKYLSDTPNQSNTAPQVASTEEAANKLGTGAMAIFSLFFMGAIASCIGGYAGVASREEYDKKRAKRARS